MMPIDPISLSYGVVIGTVLASLTCCIGMLLEDMKRIEQQCQQSPDGKAQQSNSVQQ